MPDNPNDTFEFDENDDEPWDSPEGECLGCDSYGLVNDLGLCEECAAKLERDLIRHRDWDYSVTAYDRSSEAREELHLKVIEQYGEELELLAPQRSGRRKRKLGKRKKRKKRKRGSL